MIPETLIIMAMSQAALPPRIERRRDYAGSAAVSRQVHEFDTYIFNLRATDHSVTFAPDRTPEAKAQEDQPKSHLETMIDELLADVPEEEWAKMPVDFASSVEKTLYG